MTYKGKKVAFVFPGQGAQYVGMGLDFGEKYPELLKPLIDFDFRNETNLYDIMKNGPEELLTETKWTQPAILYHSITAMSCLLNSVAIEPDYVAGHSLGEFTALVANGVLSIEDAMYLVHKRGEFMIKANDGTPFAMSAIIGLEPAVLTDICSEISRNFLVVVANYNTPEQTVISGTSEGVAQASQKAKEAGAKRVVPLTVGGAFHSPLISKAGIWLAEEMKGIVFQDSDVPVISNVDAQPHTLPHSIMENLAKQVTSPVQWVESINNLITLGTDLFLEFGPKKVIGGMLKKIDRNIDVMSVDTYEDINIVKERLEQL